MGMVLFLKIKWKLTLSLTVLNHHRASGRSQMRETSQDFQKYFSLQKGICGPRYLDSREQVQGGEREEAMQWPFLEENKPPLKKILCDISVTGSRFLPHPSLLSPGPCQPTLLSYCVFSRPSSVWNNLGFHTITHLLYNLHLA